jgi:hypothetical protein
MEEEELEKTDVVLPSSVPMYRVQNRLKEYFNSIRGLNELISKIIEEGLDVNVTLGHVLDDYISINNTDIETKILELEETKTLNNALHLALLHLKSGRIPSGPYYKTTKAGEYLYSLYNINRSKASCRQLINKLIKKEDGRGLVARGPKRGADSTVYKSDIDKWFKEFGNDLTFRRHKSNQ